MRNNEYKIVELYDQTELNSVREIVTSHTRTITNCRTLQLEQYHDFVDEQKHRTVGDKKLRVLTSESAQILENLGGTKRIFEENPGYSLGNIIYNSKEMEQRPEFYFRLVRPNRLGDVGPPHCDYWFHEAMGTGWSIGNTIKYWIPIVIESELNGLLFYPEAPTHVPFKILEKGGLKRPVIDIPITRLGSPILPALKLGQALKFNDNVLHAGAPNKGRFTRVSMEITLVKSAL